MLSSKFSSLLRFFVFSLRRFARMTWSLTLYYEPLSTSPTLHEFPLSLARSPLSRIPRIRQENFSLISSSPFPPSLLSPPLTYSASSRVINNASSRHQSELLSSAKEVVAASRQLKLPLQSFMSWIGMSVSLSTKAKLLLHGSQESRITTSSKIGSLISSKRSRTER